MNAVPESAEAVPFCTVKARFAVCVRLPLVPCAVMVKFPAAADGEAPNKTSALLPAETGKGLAGLELIPDGKPLSATWTDPEKPLAGVMLRETDELVAP